MSSLFTFTRPFLAVVALLLISLTSRALPRGAAALLMYEQKYVNRNLDTNKIMALQNHQAEQYSPENGEIFQLKSYWIPAENSHVFQTPADVKELGLTLSRRERGRVQVLFLVHPESESFFEELIKTAERGPIFEATATASSRTLMAWPQGRNDKIFFAKLSLNKKIGGVIRTIPKGEISRSVGVSMILDAAKSELPADFLYLPEFFGVMPKGMDRGGQILRALPPAMSRGESRIMPMFAIYTSPGDGTVAPIETMISLSGRSAKAFVTDSLLRPFAKQWVDLVVNHGIAVEAHAQNVLIEIDARGLPTGRFVYRDFGGFNIDLEFRRSRGLPMPPSLPVIESEYVDYHQEFHEKAVKQSLATYFEGGFLFGLGAELARLGYENLNYQKLMALFRAEVNAELIAKGAKVETMDFYSGLAKSVKKARSKLPMRAGKCSLIFKAS